MKNLVCRTEAIFHRRDGQIEEHEDHYVIRTPDNPSFWFGNFILFKDAPVAGNLEAWLETHRAAFGGSLNHITLGWDEPEQGSIQQFIDAGFRRSNGISLSMTEYAGTAKTNPDLVVRPLEHQNEWDAMLEQQLQVDAEDFDYPDDDGVFRARQMAASKRMADEGHGDWWGAYLGEQLVGGMGLFFDEAKSIGRFQYVTTSAKHRRNRVCTTLLDQVVRHAFTTVNPDLLVICTDAARSNMAAKAYRNFGFKEAMSSYAVIRLDSKPAQDR